MVDDVLLAGLLFLEHFYDTIDLLPDLVWPVGGETDATPARSDFEEEDGSKGNHGGDVEGDANEGVTDIGHIEDH